MKHEVFSEKVNNARLYFAISILLGHYTAGWNIGDWVWCTFILVAMTFFYFMAGYWFAFSYQKYSWQELLKKKVKSLLIPFLIWKIFGVVVNFLFHVLRRDSDWKNVKYIVINGNAPILFLVKLFVLMCIVLLLKDVIMHKKWGVLLNYLCINCIFKRC